MMSPRRARARASGEVWEGKRGKGRRWGQDGKGVFDHVDLMLHV